MQDGQLCLLSPGERWWTYSILKEEKNKKTKAKTSRVECGASRVEEGGGGGPESIALIFSFFFFLFFTAHY